MNEYELNTLGKNYGLTYVGKEMFPDSEQYPVYVSVEKQDTGKAFVRDPKTGIFVDYVKARQNSQKKGGK